LIEVVQLEGAGFTTQFSIYNRDGIYLAKVRGARLFLTDEGEKANLALRHPGLRTICELDGKTIFEVSPKEAGAVKAEAELYSPDGRFLKKADSGMPSELISADGSALRIGGIVMTGNYFEGLRIGVHIRRDGSLAIRVN
jgi:hypothetical protein